MLNILKSKNANTGEYTYLSEKIEQEKKESRTYNSIVEKRTSPLWIPSKDSFLKLVLIFLSLVVIVKFGTTYSVKILELIPIFKNWPELIELIKGVPIIKGDSDSLQLLIAVNSGIGAVLTGLAFFVAQSLMSSNDSDRARVLLYKSKFFPLLALEIFVFFLLMMGEINYSIYFITFFLGIFTIVSLGETIKILIKNNDLENAKSAVFFDILKNYFVLILDNEINKRLSNNIFYEYIRVLSDDNNIKINHTPLLPFNKDFYITIKVPDDGRYTDINLKKLEGIISQLSAVSYEDSGIDVDSNKDSIDVPLVKDNDKDPSIIFHSIIYDEVRSSDALLSIKKDLIEDIPNFIKELDRNLSSIFIIETTNKEEQEARFEISKLKERSIDAIRNKKTSEIEKNLKIYDDLIIEFYKFMEPYGAYSKKQAEQERTALFSYRIKPLDWISRDIWEIFENGTKSDDIHTIRQVAYLPVMLSKTAIKYNDHLIFQSYLRYVIYLYKIGYSKQNESNISSFMIDRSGRYLTELIDYYLTPHYEKNQENSWAEFKDFAQYILKVFQELIKNSYDNDDYENYKKFIEKMNRTFESFKYTDYKKNQVLLNLKQELLFGLGSWILSKTIEKNSVTDKKFLSLIVIYLSSDIQKLSNTFLRVNSEIGKTNWNFENWEFDNKNENQVFVSSTLKNLRFFYYFIILKNAGNHTKKEIINIELPLTIEFISSTNNNSELPTFLEEIRKYDIWHDLLTENEVEKINQIKRLFLKTEEKYVEKEKQIIRETRMSLDKVDSFKMNFEKNLKQSFGIKEIYKKYKKWHVIKKEAHLQNNYNKLGINSVYDKLPFTAGNVLPYKHYPGFDSAFDIGKSIVRGENHSIISKLNKELPEISNDKINRSIQMFDSIEDLIMISVNNAAYYQFEYKKTSEFYIPNSSQDFDSFDMKDRSGASGIYKIEESIIPVYNIYTQDDRSILIILDTRYMGTLNQYVENDLVQESRVKEFQINIKEIKKDSIEEQNLLKDSPYWLKEQGDEENQSNYLQEKVVIEIYEKINFDINQKIEGAVLYVKNN